MLVSEKPGLVVRDAPVAVTVYDPVTPLAVNAGDLATPCALVLTVFTPPAKVPLAPLLGALKVIMTFCTGLPNVSFNVAESACGKAVLIGVLCGVPPVAVSDAGVPDWFVRAKPGLVVSAAVVAVTV